MKNKAVFVDRDGVLNEDSGYTYQLTDLRLLDGVIEGLKSILALDFKVIIITNQSGIARELFSTEELHSFMRGLTNILLENQITVTDYFYCPHHPKGRLLEYSKKCSCRKPEPGMLFDAEKKHNLDLSKSILIGDKETDILAGQNANLFSNILISSEETNDKSNATHIAQNLIDAAEIIKTYNL
jgi:D-glycero-D-manno-heptose 1,7-bisphosphate phosphatase|tara:strand:- start:466 stop:1017 length:552 start_codon:yes stop_codon:yes gene_type:complete